MKKDTPKKESPPDIEIIDIKEKMAGAMLAWILPVLGVAFTIALCSQLVRAEGFIRMLPTVASFVLFLYAFFSYRRGKKLFAARLLIAFFLLGLASLVIYERSFGNYGGLVLSSILICWFCWFFHRYLRRTFLVLLIISFLTVSLLGLKGLITVRNDPFPITNLIMVPFLFVILHASILSPLRLLMQSYKQSRRSETKAKIALDALRQSRSFTIQAVDHSRQYFGWLTPDGTLQYSNSTSLALLRKNAADVVGKPFWESPYFSHDRNEVTKLKESIEKVKNGEVIEYTFLFPVTDKSTIEVDFSLHPIFDAEGEVSMIVAEGRDITKEQEAIRQKEKTQEQLHQVQKMDAVGQLAGGIAHDFNNTLAGIIGGAELLQDENVDSETRNHYANMILNSAERAGELTKKLLAFSRKESKTMRNVDIIHIVNDTTAMLRRTIDKKITISIENDAHSTVTMGDDALLQNVLLNLGINAGHAMPDGGTLTFNLSNTVLDEEYCRFSSFNISPGEFVRISVSDTGCGMTPEVQSRIFEPFFTTKEPGKGTGLGLSAAYGTVLDHNGLITVYSEPDGGTVFHLYLPLADSSVSSGDEQILEKGSGTILLIDDEEMIRITASAILTRLGYDVLTAENGKVGVGLYKEHIKDINLVILDMIMPVMGGKEVLEIIHRIDPEMPVIIASGFSKGSDEKTLREKGVSGFLLKPYRRAELAAMVAESLRRKKTVQH